MRKMSPFYYFSVNKQRIAHIHQRVLEMMHATKKNDKKTKRDESDLQWEYLLFLHSPTPHRSPDGRHLFPFFFDGLLLSLSLC